MPYFTIQWWIILKIWFFSIVFNTLAGMVYLVTAMQEAKSIPELLIGGSFLGGFFSLPALLVLFLVLNRCFVRDTSWKRTFRMVLLAAVALYLITSLIFIAVLGEIDRVVAWFPLIAVLSAVAGTATQYGAIRHSIPEIPELD